MVSVGFRATFSNDQLFGEPEQDANTALTELDKGLRSARIGEQCEAIVRFPRLFEKYPFPILINSAFLKLAEVFRVGTNFPRLCVLRVCQQSEKHLDKILNVDEFVKRIFTVIHSNDPIARSLALRTLGSIAMIISERKSVHHSIRDGLDSHDAVELDAAIYAASTFAAQSRTFAVNMCSKIAQMIQGLATPSNIKLKLIPILQFMHHDAHTAAMVRRLCTDLLPSYPAEDFVVITLHTLTLLARETLVEIPQQLLLLLSWLHDSRQAVQLRVLSDLKILADKGAHLWTVANVESLVDFLLEQPLLERETLNVLVRLARTEAATCFALKTDSKLSLIWSRCCYSGDTWASAKAVQLLVQLVVQSTRTDQPGDLCHEASLAVESLITTLCYSASVDHRVLKIALSSAVQLSRERSQVSGAIVECLTRLLAHAHGRTLVLLCESLAAVGDVQPGVIAAALVEVTSLLKRIAGKDCHETQVILLLCVLIFQTHVSHCWSTHAMVVVSEAVLKVDLWVAYKIARSGARYGHHAIAKRILDRVLANICSEHLHFWLQGLRDFTAAEAFLSTPAAPGSGDDDDANTLMDRLVLASKQYLQGLSSLKAASSATCSLQFQTEFGRLRVEFLWACSQLVQACKTLQTAPPPAIAHAVASATRDELQRCGRVTHQLRKCVKDLKMVADSFAKLYQSSFDADSDSLMNMQIQQQMALLLAQTIETTCLWAAQQGTMAEEADVSSLVLVKADASHRIAIRSMAGRCSDAALLAQTFKRNHPELRLINHLNVQCLFDTLRLVIETPLCFPRFLFQTLQTTVIKLAVSPQPRVAGEPVTTPIGAHLAVKVEGVAQLTSQQKVCRKVRAVQVTVTSQSNVPTPDTKPTENGSCLMKTVEPHNDYFSAQFLLSFATAGLHQVYVDTALLDGSDALWNAGPKAQLSVKTFEESNSKSSANSSAARAAAVATSSSSSAVRS